MYKYGHKLLVFLGSGIIVMGGYQLFVSIWSSGDRIRFGRYMDDIISVSGGHWQYNDNTTEQQEYYSDGNSSVSGGHWKYTENNHVPYYFSSEVCSQTYTNEGDCSKTKLCPNNLMNWRYYDINNKPYPNFDVAGFRTRMRNKRIVFVGDSTMRQQVQALVWTLGHEVVQWKKMRTCHGSSRYCTNHNSITICLQNMGSMAKQVYHEGNYTLDHSRRGQGDSSCLLRDQVIDQLSSFDFVFVQGVVWWAGLPRLLNSTSSPANWVSDMIPTVYHDAMEAFLSKLSVRTKTILVLGQVGTDCRNKTEPELFSQDVVDSIYGWDLGAQLWDVSLDIIKERVLDVQVIDARDPLMQSVHAHPRTLPQPDCLHLCLNSAAVNIYLDIYWNEVFSWY